MFNVQQITSRLSMMSDAQLAHYAELHKDDPYILPLASAEAKRRQQNRLAAAGRQAAQAGQKPTIADQNIASMQLPEDQGIGVLPETSLAMMADGGIAGYATGGVPQSEREKYRAYALRKAREMGLDPKFVDGIFQIESGYNPTAKSRTGPEGIGQLAKNTGLAKGLKPEERKDPYKNMDAAMSLMKDFFNKYKDPAKVAVAYNQGEGVLNDHLKKNKGKLVPEKLHESVRTRNKQEPLNYLKKLNNYIPIPAAAAADMPPRGEAKVSPSSGAPAARGVAALPALPKEPAASAASAAPAVAGTPTPDLRYKDIPGTPDAIEYERQLRAARGPEPSWLKQRGIELLGAPEAGLSALTGAISPLTGTLYAGARTLAGTPTTAEEGFGAMTFAPRSEAGKESLYQLNKALVEDAKIPPFIPGVGTVSARPKAGKAITAAELAEAEAARAAQAAETAKAPRLEGPKPAGASRASDLQQRFAEAQERSAKALEQADLLATSVVDGKLMTGKQKAAALRASMPKIEGFTPDPAAQQLGVEALLRRRRAEQAKDVMRAKEDAAKAARKAEEAAVIAEREKALDRGDTTFATARRQAEARRNILAPGVIGAGAGVKAPVPEPSDYVVPKEELGSQDAGFPLTAPETKPEVAPDKLEAAKELAQQVAPKTGGLSNEDILTMGLNMMMAQPGQPGGALSQLLSNVGRSGIATLGARREREQREQEKEYKDVMKQYYGKLTELYGRPEAEERQIAQIMKENPGISYEDAVQRLYSAKYASRGETTLEAARLRNPFAALFDQGLMEPGGGLTPQGQSVFNKYFPKQ